MSTPGKHSKHVTHIASQAANGFTANDVKSIVPPIAHYTRAAGQDAQIEAFRKENESGIVGKTLSGVNTVAELAAKPAHYTFFGGIILGILGALTYPLHLVGYAGKGVEWLENLVSKSSGHWLSGKLRAFDAFHVGTRDTVRRSYGAVHKHVMEHALDGSAFAPGVQDTIKPGGIASGILGDLEKLAVDKRGPESRIGKWLGTGAKKAGELEDKWLPRFTGWFTRNTGKVGDALHTGFEKVGLHKVWGVKAIPQNVKNLPNHFKEMSLAHAGWTVTAVTGTALQAYTTTRSVGQEIEAFRELYADLNGGKKPQGFFGTLSALMNPGDSGLVREARNRILKRYAPSYILQAVGLVLNIKTLKRGSSGIANASMMAVAFADIGIGMLSGEHFLPVLGNIKRMEAHHIPVDTAGYASLIFTASKEVRDSAESVNDPRVLAVAEYYAANRVPSSVVMQQIASGEFHKVATQAFAAKKAEFEQLKQQEAAQQTPAQTPVAAPEESKIKQVLGKHTERVLQAETAPKPTTPPLPETPKDVQGKHTGNLAAAAIAGAPSLAAVPG